jgi:hypothetical protein
MLLRTRHNISAENLIPAPYKTRCIFLNYTPHGRSQEKKIVMSMVGKVLKLKEKAAPLPLCIIKTFLGIEFKLLL